jgi:hypothetical protein
MGDISVSGAKWSAIEPTVVGFFLFVTELLDRNTSYLKAVYTCDFGYESAYDLLPMVSSK